MRPDQDVAGSLPLEIVARAGDAARTVDRIDVFVDDLLVGIVTNLPPVPGNRVLVEIDGLEAG